MKMAKVKLHLLNIFYLKIRENVLDYEADNIKQLISKFVTEFKEKIGDEFLNNKGNFLSKQILILVNGRNIKYLSGKNTQLNEEDKVYISIPVAGG